MTLDWLAAPRVWVREVEFDGGDGTFTRTRSAKAWRRMWYIYWRHKSRKKSGEDGVDASMVCDVVCG